MRLLVTGGAGFVGVNFVRRRRTRCPGDTLVVLDALTYAANPASLDGVAGVELIRGDVCDRALVARVLAEHRIEAIVNLAAETHVDRSILGPAPFVRTNVLGTAVLLECARDAGVERLVHVSTDEVYGELAPDAAPWTEAAPLAPRSPYAASKAAADLLVLSWVATYGFPAVITRCGNNYGPYQFPEKLVPLMTLAALHDEPLPVYGDGLQVRDWIHVDDHCAALERVLEDGRDGHVYHIGARDQRKNLEVVHAILEATGKPASLIRHVADRPGHDRRYALDPGKLERELGWAPARPFAAGLAETVAWYRDNPQWWQDVRSGEYLRWYERNYAGRAEVTP